MLPAWAGSTFSNLNGPRPPSWANLRPIWSKLGKLAANLVQLQASFGQTPPFQHYLRPSWAQMRHGACEKPLFSIGFCVFLKYRPSCNLKLTWANLNQLGANFVQNWVVPTWGQFALTCNHLGPTWAQCGCDMGQLGPTWPIWANLKSTWSQLGPTWGKLVTNLGTPWANLGLASANFCQLNTNPC